MKNAIIILYLQFVAYTSTLFYTPFVIVGSTYTQWQLCSYSSYFTPIYYSFCTLEVLKMSKMTKKPIALQKIK